MHSFNHYSLGSCVEWLYSHVLGIKLTEDKRICIAPSLSSEITYVKGEYQSWQGKIYVEWTYQDGKYYVTVRTDKGVDFSYDFGDREVLSLEINQNVLKAIVK